MLALKILEKEELRNFIYDPRPKKVLVGSRSTGKTSTLLQALIRNIATSKKERPSVYVAHSISSLSLIYNHLKKLCDEQDIRISKAEPHAGVLSFYLEHSRVYIVSAATFMSQRFRGVAFSDTYIDEPNFMKNFNDMMREIEYLTYKYKDSKILIAGSNNISGQELMKISADLSYSRHTIKAESYATRSQMAELKRTLSPEQFATEIECKFL